MPDNSQDTKLRQFREFAECAGEAPGGTYEECKQVRAEVGAFVDSMIRRFKAMRLSVDNCDGAYALEAEVYAWLRRANPGRFEASEGMGSSLLAGGAVARLARASAERERDERLGRPMARASLDAESTEILSDAELLGEG